MTGKRAAGNRRRVPFWHCRHFAKSLGAPLQAGCDTVDVSVIIPAFNRLWSLPAAIASVSRSPDTEIIVVDDGSTDGTWDWLAAQSGLVAVRQDNAGKPNAVNRAVGLARGRFVRFLDSDDLLATDAASAQLRFALARDPAVCVAGYLARYEPDGAEVAHPWVDCGDFLAQQLGECDSSHYSAFLFRRDAIAEVAHRPDFALRDDRMFMLEVALTMPDVAIWPELTLIHRHHARARIQFQGGSTAVVTNWQERRMFERVIALMRTRGLFTERRGAAMATNLWELAQRTGAYSGREAREVLGLLHALAPDFVPRGGRNELYRRLGFPLAQAGVNLARALRNLGRRVHAG